MTDFSKVKSILHPLGKVQAIHRAADGALLWKSESKNRVAYSAEAEEETVYHGALGCKNDYSHPASGTSLMVTRNEEIV